MGGIERKAIAEAFPVCPYPVFRASRYYRIRFQTGCGYIQVAPMNEQDILISDLCLALAACCETSKVIIVEINENMPVCLGSFEKWSAHFQVDMIVEGSNLQSPRYGLLEHH